MNNFLIEKILDTAAAWDFERLQKASRHADFCLTLALLICI